MHAVLKLLALNLVQLLRLHDILKTALVTKCLQFVEQMQLVLLEFLNTLVQGGHRVEHLIVLVLELKPLILGLLELFRHDLKLILELIDAGLLVIKVLLDLRTSCNCLYRQLLGLVFVEPQVVNLLLKGAHLLASMLRISLSTLLLLFCLFADGSFSTEDHG